MKKKKKPKYILSPLNSQMINYQVYYLSASEKILYSVILFIVGGLAGQVFYGGLFKQNGEATTMTTISNIVFFVLVGLLAVKLFLPAVAESFRVKRSSRLRRQFMDFLDNLTSSLASGGTVNNAVIAAERELSKQYGPNEPIVLELKEIVNGINNGQTLETMLSSFAERSGDEDVENFSNIITNCLRIGGDFRDVIIKTRSLISSKIAIADEIETKLTSNKMQLNAMCLMPVFLVGMLKGTSSMFSENLSTPLGVIVTTIAIGIFVGAYMWGNKIIDVR